jgi:hypothetical protein
MSFIATMVVRRRCQHQCEHEFDSTMKFNSTFIEQNEEDAEFEEFKEFVKEAGIPVTFTDCSDLRAQCAKVRLEHMMEEIKAKARISQSVAK